MIWVPQCIDALGSESSMNLRDHPQASWALGYLKKLFYLLLLPSREIGGPSFPPNRIKAVEPFSLAFTSSLPLAGEAAMPRREVRDFQKALEHEWKVGVHFYKVALPPHSSHDIVPTVSFRNPNHCFSRVKLK